MNNINKVEENGCVASGCGCLLSSLMLFCAVLGAKSGAGGFFLLLFLITISLSIMNLSHPGIMSFNINGLLLNNQEARRKYFYKLMEKELQFFNQKGLDELLKTIWWGNKAVHFKEDIIYVFNEICEHKENSKKAEDELRRIRSEQYEKEQKRNIEEEQKRKLKEKEWIDSIHKELQETRNKEYELAKIENEKIIRDLKEKMTIPSCERCGEDLWTFIRYTPNKKSAQLSCSSCGKKCYLKFEIKEYKKNNRERIPDKIRREVWRRDEGKCVKCGSREKLEFDHIVPVSEGGSNTARNIELLCEKCNRIKSNKI
jgi:hypothetical protein